MDGWVLSLLANGPTGILFILPGFVFLSGVVVKTSNLSGYFDILSENTS